VEIVSLTSSLITTDCAKIDVNMQGHFVNQYI